MNENWLPVVGYEGLYEVSDLGRVRSLARNTTKGKVLKLGFTGDKYQMIGLYKEGVKTSFRVHCLVAFAFLGHKLDGMEIRHVNGNCLDNSRENLCYGTRQENIDDKVRHGTNLNGCKNPQAKLTKSDVLCIRSSMESQRQLARNYGVSKSAIAFVLNRKTWAHV